MLSLFDRLLASEIFIAGIGVVISAAFIAVCRKLPSGMFHWLHRELVVSVDITDDSQAYFWLKAWLDQHPSQQKTRLLTAWVSTEQGSQKICLGPGPGLHFFRHNGKLFWLIQRRTDITMQSMFAFRESVQICTFSRSQKCIREVLSEVEMKGLERESGMMSVYITAWGSWFRSLRKKPRSIDSVIIPREQKAAIIKSIDSFLASEEFYESTGIPYRLGFLLHGIPGSGKSSLVEALAGHYGRNVYLVGLASVGMNDERLTELLKNVPSRDIVLIEDIDAVFNGRKQAGSTDNAPSTVTFSGLINAIDGIAAKHGRILFVTTNHIGKLDPALVRPGRVDMSIEFTYATSEQIGMMAIRFGYDAQTATDWFNGRQVSMAEVQNEFLRMRNGR